MASDKLGEFIESFCVSAIEIKSFAWWACTKHSTNIFYVKAFSEPVTHILKSSNSWLMPPLWLFHSCQSNCYLTILFSLNFSVILSSYKCHCFTIMIFWHKCSFIWLTWDSKIADIAHQNMPPKWAAKTKWWCSSTKSQLLSFSSSNIIFAQEARRCDVAPLKFVPLAAEIPKIAYLSASASAVIIR